MYIDLKSAFDKVWHKGVLYKLAKMGINGHLAKWINNYLQNRSIKVNIKATLSDPIPLNNGVPLGAILSPLLFDVMLNDFPSNSDIKVYSYAIDITISVKGNKVDDLKRKMQLNLRKVENWFDTWGLMLSPEKNSTQIFTRK